MQARLRLKAKQDNSYLLWKLLVLAFQRASQFGPSHALQDRSKFKEAGSVPSLCTCYPNAGMDGLSSTVAWAKFHLSAAAAAPPDLCWRVTEVPGIGFREVGGLLAAARERQSPFPCS